MTTITIVHYNYERAISYRASIIFARRTIIRARRAVWAGRMLKVAHSSGYFYTRRNLFALVISYIFSLTRSFACVRARAQNIARCWKSLCSRHTMEEDSTSVRRRLWRTGYVQLFINVRWLTENRNFSAFRTAYPFQPTYLPSRPFCMSNTQGYIILPTLARSSSESRAIMPNSCGIHFKRCLQVGIVFHD